MVAEAAVVGNVDGERRGGRRTSVVVGIGAGGTRGREEGLAGLLGTPGARRRAQMGAMAAVATAVTQQGDGELWRLRRAS